MSERSYTADAPRRSTLHGRLVPLAAALLTGAFATDVLYLMTVSGQWETFSVWLLTAGLLVTAVAALALGVDAVDGRTPQIAWGRFALFAAAGVLSIVNAFVHSRDGYTAVAPTGVVLSAVTTVLLLVAAVGGWDLNARARR